MTEIAKKLSNIRRARDYHLFDEKGRRYLDLRQNGGRALLGHRPAGLFSTLKNEMQKGVLAEAPSVYDGRFEKAVLRLVPGVWTLGVFRSFDRALRAAEEYLGGALSEEALGEPFFEETHPAGFFRPFFTTDYSRFSVLFPILPFPGGFAPQAVLFRASGEGVRRPPPPGDIVSPVLLAGLVRITEELREIGDSPDIWKDWNLPGWDRYGCYCFPRIDSGKYGKVFERFLDAGVLISPNPKTPTILPRLFSLGEKKLVERLCAAVVSGGVHES